MIAKYAIVDALTESVGWAKALLAPCPREVSRQIELRRVGTADPASCINRNLAAAFAHPTARFGTGMERR